MMGGGMVVGVWTAETEQNPRKGEEIGRRSGTLIDFANGRGGGARGRGLPLMMSTENLDFLPPPLFRIWN